MALSVLACSSQTNTLPTGMPGLRDTATGTSASTPASVSTGTPIPSATQPAIPPGLASLPAPALARIDFQDENAGWGIAFNKPGFVVRTVDGGSTWWNVSPPRSESIGLSTNLIVLDSQTAWVLVPGTDFFSARLYRTADGGINWSSNPVPFGRALLQFQAGGSGQALAEREAAAGSEAVELFQTSDEGATWKSVFHNDPSQPGASETLPLEGIKMTFLDAQTGWVTGSSPADGDVYLYITQDGGASWSQQSLALPTGYASDQYIPQAPVFFGKDGFLPLTIGLAGSTEFTVYATHDGGLTWSGAPGNTKQTIPPGLPAFADARHIWSWDGGTTFYSTSDGAQTWSGSIASLNLSGNLEQMEFVPAAAGRFTGWALTRLDETGHSQLYRTKDGINWTPLIH